MIFDKDVHNVQRIKHNYSIVISNQMVDCASIITAGLKKGIHQELTSILWQDKEYQG